MVYGRYMESEGKFSSLLNKARYFFNFKNVLFMIFSFVLSSQMSDSGYPLLSVALFGVANIFNVPLLLVGVFSGFGLLVTGISFSAGIKLLAIFVLFIIITSLINIEGLTKKYSTLLKLIISITIVEIVAGLIGGTLFTNILTTLQTLITVSIFYMVFVPGAYVILNFKEGYAYSKEETVASVILLATLTSIFSGLKIYNVSIMNILLFLIVLIYGWKTNFLLGGVAGLTSGLILTMVTNVDVVTIIMLGFSGIIAGILSKFGKIGVIIGFVLGNVYIIFYASGLSSITLRLAEMLIASTALFVLPKKLEKKIEHFFDLNMALSNPYENMLDSAEDAKTKLNAVSSIFENLANVSILNSEKEKLDLKKIVKRYMLDYIESSCIECAVKRECKNRDRIDLIAGRIVEKFEQNERIDESLFNDLECTKKEELTSGLEEVYRNIKVMNFLKQKELEDSNKIAKTYKELSSILRNVSKNIKANILVKDDTQLNLRNELKIAGYFVYEDEYSNNNDNIEYTFVTNILTNIEKQKKEIISVIEHVTNKKVMVKLILNTSKTEKSKIKVISIPKYELKTTVVSHNKDENEISGDSYLISELSDKKQAVIISDGASSGKEAKESSMLVINTLEKLISSGFDMDKSIEIINSIMKLKEEGKYATLDMCVFDLNSCGMNLIKIGAAPTYILDEMSKVTVINEENAPLGISENSETLNLSQSLSENAIVIQMSDGVLDENFDINNNFITTYLKSVDSRRNIKQISEDLNKLIVKAKGGTFNDDITLIVSKISKND